MEKSRVRHNKFQTTGSPRDQNKFKLSSLKSSDNIEKEDGITIFSENESSTAVDTGDTRGLMMSK